MAGRHIVPFGGLTPTPGRVHPLVDYLLTLTGKPRAKVAFIPTATGDSTETLVRMYARFPADRSERSHLSLFDRTVENIEGYLLAQDIIVVGGGNTANMLAVWKVHGVDDGLRAAWEAGIVLTGGSAGSLCWFEAGTTDSFNLLKLAPLHQGLGFLQGSHCPHYEGEAQRRPLYHRLILDGFPAGYAIDIDAAIHFAGSEVAVVVTARDGAPAYRVDRVNGQVLETRMEPRLLTGAISRSPASI
jgi:peptidase E